MTMMLDMFGYERPVRQVEDQSETDACSLIGANRLKQQIEDYWAAKGQKVVCWVALCPVRASRSHSAGVWMVRSHTINGIPQ